MSNITNINYYVEGDQIIFANNANLGVGNNLSNRDDCLHQDAALNTTAESKQTKLKDMIPIKNIFLFIIFLCFCNISDNF